MRNKIIFFVMAITIAILLSAIAAAGALGICYLAGLSGPALVAACGTTAAAVFGGVLALASLAAKLFFS
jgi:hypothetical protein